MKYYKLIIKNFDQVKKHNFDQVNFGQVIISPINQSYYTIKCEKHVSYHRVSQSINHITQSNVKSMSHITE
jgi:hypothetical protein